MALNYSPEYWDPRKTWKGFSWSRFFERFSATSNNTVRDPPLDASDIKLTKEDFNGSEVGVVYLLTNDYHAEDKAAIRDHGKDRQRMTAFFESCVDRYVVKPHTNATAKRFLATCRSLANCKYPEHCDRIIIYFAGHGKDGYITMEKDYSNANISGRNRKRQVI